MTWVHTLWQNTPNWKVKIFIYRFEWKWEIKSVEKKLMPWNMQLMNYFTHCTISNCFIYYSFIWIFCAGYLIVETGSLYQYGNLWSAISACVSRGLRVNRKGKCVNDFHVLGQTQANNTHAGHTHTGTHIKKVNCHTRATSTAPTTTLAWHLLQLICDAFECN